MYERHCKSFRSLTAVVTDSADHSNCVTSYWLTSPLYVKALLYRHHKPIRNKIILDSWVHLDDITPLPTHVEVEDLATLGLPVLEFRPRTEYHDVTAILEGPPKLGRVDGETQRLVGGGANVDIGVLGHWRTNPSSTAWEK